MKILNQLTTQFLHCFAPETAHHLAIKMLRHLPAQNVLSDIDSNIFSQELLGMKFTHPLGLAAGFDKNADVFDKLGQLGFSFVEVGSVTPRPQPGNPKPRLFRLPEQQAIINRYGFNSEGLDYMAQHLQQYPRTCITGINLGKNKETTNYADDFLRNAEVLCTLGDYFVVNVSSPNTPGLRDLQTPEALAPIIDGIQDIIRRKKPGLPLFVKISPDMTVPQETALLEFLITKAVNGIIISNTTLSREGVEGSKNAAEAGGLSGPPLKERTTAMLRRAYKITQGKLVLIGCGGISSGLDAYEKLRAGADLLQIYTSFVYHGPLVIRKILVELAELLKRDGVKNVREIIGHL